MAVHAFVIGELACGQLKARDQILNLLNSLARLPAAADDEVLYFLERHRLFGRGLGYIDRRLRTWSVQWDTAGRVFRSKATIKRASGQIQGPRL